MNLVECCASYAADGSSTVMQYTAQTHTKKKNACKTKHANIINSTKICKFSV